MEEDGDTSATCSADEGNPQDMDVAFSDKAKPPSQVSQGQVRDRVSSSEDDTKLSELKAKLEVARTDNKTGDNKDPSSDSGPAEATEKAAKKTPEGTDAATVDKEGKRWSAPTGILNMRDLIHSAIHKHLGECFYHLSVLNINLAFWFLFLFAKWSKE